MGVYTFNGAKMGKSERAYVQDSSFGGTPLTVEVPQPTEREFVADDTLDDTALDTETTELLDALVVAGYATYDAGS